MTDRELLEAAAKAAGFEFVWIHDTPRILAEMGWTLWNPITDDDDAFRLAVKCRIEVEPWIHGDSACARAAVREVLIDEPHYGDDSERATRRAIVRAAAELGRSMK
jgi:hypothetical protein